MVNVNDGLQSLIGALGDPLRDKSASTFYGMPFVSDDQLLNAYRGSWLSRKIVNIPAFDGVRRWRAWNADTKQIELIEAEEKRLDLKRKVLTARVRARLWGGSAIYIGTGDQNIGEELNVDTIKKGGIRYLTVMSRAKIAAGEIEYDPTSENYEKPAYYTVNGRQIHPSRLVIFTGNEQPEPGFAVFGGVGWGDSVLLAVFDAIKNADAVPANVASLVFEANVDVFGVKDLFAQMSDPEYEKRLLNRFMLVGANKSVNRSILRDFDETYERKAISFSGLEAVIEKFLQIVSGAADIPATRLLGMSPSGMSSTGESDLRNYYDGISASQELEIEPPMRRLDEGLIRSAIGARDPSIWYQWRPLWQMSDKEKAEIGKMNAETANIISTAGLLPQLALGEALANQLTESGFYPGLEQMIEDNGGLDVDLDPPGTVDPVAGGLLPTAPVPVPPTQPVRPIADAAPRSLYINRKVLNAPDLVAWARGQGFTTVQDDLHVTIIHTRSLLDWIKVGNAGDWGSDDKGQVIVKPGGPRLMERFGDAIVLQFASTSLAWRHEDIVRMGAAVDFPDYQPHITITWQMPDGMDLSSIEPYRGEIRLGPEIFAEVDDNWKSKVIET